ncbi:hypothetical protein ABEG18_16545 [Alsobacter sp. KACC 23698]|uniref:Secreted protein n=1 Tax=Alsobacter sp. KACC 23698 TaxID=3149229 RepID=A0AAU7JAE1_9HYPH
MNASRILPTLAFSVAVSFFFVPPVIAIVKNAPAAPASAPSSSLIVASTRVSVSQPVTMQRAKPAATKDMCSPTEASSGTTSGASSGEAASAPKRSPWNRWVVASLDDR